jgi:DNA-binding transcriptional LysR family regulator
MINPNDLQYFAVIAQEGSLRKASTRLGISQPALTHSLKRLEVQCGAVLLERGRGGVRTTPSGQKLLSRSIPLLREWELLESVTDVQEVKGLCRLGCHQSVALYTLGRFIPKLLADNPALEFTLQHDLSRKITQAVVESVVDLGLVVNPHHHADLVMTELCRDEVGLWHGDSKNARDGVIIYDPSLAQAQWILRKLERAKKRFGRRIESSSLEVIRDLVMSGAGVGILPARVATAGSSAVELKRLPGTWPSFQDKIFLIYKPHFTKTALGRTVVDGINGVFQDELSF